MPTCTTASLFETNVGFVKGLDPVQRKAALLYYMALELAAIGGTDYTATMTTDLISDTNDLFEKASPDMLEIALLNIAANNAEAAGADLPATLNELNAATACCFQNAPTPGMDKIYLFLLCKLGQHAAQ